MKVFQKISGYFLLVTVASLVSKITTQLFDISYPVPFVLLLILLCLFLKVENSLDSESPFAFRVIQRSLGSFG